MKETTIRSRLNPRLEVSVIAGHFATRHSHNNHYIDITRMKHEHTMAREAAMTLAQRYAYEKGVDTIVCLDGSEVLGAFLARHLAKNTLFAVNSDKNINVITPEYDSNGQLLFRDNLVPMVTDRNVLILISTVNSGKSIRRVVECAQYYGGKVQGIAAVFSTLEEMEGVPHHLIDILEPWEEFNVVVFQKHCLECMEQIYDRSHIPILVGGTGFYIQALLYDIDFTEQQCDETYRRQLEDLAREHGAEYLHGILREVDPASAEAIHANNIKRVIRALEFYHLSGKKISEHNETERQKQSPYNFAYFVLTDERAKLYERIDRRVNAMIEAGLVEEVKKLKSMGCSREMVSMQGLGYKELFGYFEGEYPLEEAVRIIQRDTRHFAKRQLTWFRRERDVIWIDKSIVGRDEDKLITFMLDQLRKKEIIR